MHTEQEIENTDTRKPRIYEDLSGGSIDTLVFHNHVALVNVVHIVGTVGLVAAMAQMRIA